ncbi:putative Exportin-1 [Monoraphidium neglectum]|uniref:Putative Exportin-1 n=1 Tax=Monoraphidium neglectum TaxID=145388 RepID=A0A0D2J6B3_9CHLO|nr:putative Exportin-1 [Monoraphidium neglectum]KIY95402.1 putative Exportin-1 [Monoraphidium neglectum]|eukprot:XP_013894422.1 putative Exportin-1 [Monoraphidium neglectum]
MAATLDLNAVDVPQLEALVAQFYGAGTQDQRASAEKALKAYQDHPDAWSRVDSILEKAQTQQTKFFALQILESVIKFRWGALPVEQREGVKNYVSNLIIKYATNEQLFRAESVFMGKLNMVLVQILKQDWPDRCGGLRPCPRPRLAADALPAECPAQRPARVRICDKTRHLKHTLNAQFRMIHELCTFVLLNTRKESLVRATLTALHAYLSWVPVG